MRHGSLNSLFQVALYLPSYPERELIDYTTSMITDEDPLRELLFYYLAMPPV